MLSGEFPIFPLLDMIRKDAKLHAYSMFNHVMDESQLEEGKKYILNRIKKGNLKPLVDKIFEFKDTIEAYNYMLTNKQKGKIVVKMT
jgi:NADPH:quinone reductase-like Zn-dependent oxidoreductase